MLKYLKSSLEITFWNNVYSYKVVLTNILVSLSLDNIWSSLFENWYLVKCLVTLRNLFSTYFVSVLSGSVFYIAKDPPGDINQTCVDLKKNCTPSTSDLFMEQYVYIL